MIYLGDNEVTIYRGDNEPVIYMGDNQVYPTGPFVGIKINKKAKLTTTSLETTIKVKSTEEWTLTTDLDWITLSETAGTATSGTNITITATAQSASTTGYISAVTANYSAVCEVIFTKAYWMWVDANIDRSLPLTKCRFYQGNIPAGTGQYGVTEGAFSELPNKNSDGTFVGRLDQVEYGYARYHKFNMVIDGGTYTDDWNHTNTTEYRIHTLPSVATNVYELDFGGTLYWCGIEGASNSPIYLNGNLIEVYVSY